MYQLELCTPEDSDTCLSSSPRWSDHSVCSNKGIGYCKSWEKDFKRCCPITCGVKEFTKDECKESKASGTCIYPNYAQCPKKGK